MSLRRRESAKGVGGGVGGPLVSGAFGERFPTVWEFLTRVQWDDGKRRSPGSLTIFMDDGAVKVCVFDKDAGEVAFVSAAGVDGLLEALERGLEGDSLDWRRSRPTGARGGRGK